jgi:hypothetical protein
MLRSRITIAGMLVIVAAALGAGRAEAGASASAASKYTNATRVASVHQVRAGRQARGTDFAITEYSSSSARNHLPQR